VAYLIRFVLSIRIYSFIVAMPTTVPDPMWEVWFETWLRYVDFTGCH